MSENIAARVGRIISGGINALVDAVESAAPEVVMEQAVREVDAAIDEVRAELGRVVANKHLANTRLMQENAKHEQLAEQIELALREGREDLAEAAIAQQMDIEAQIPVLENTIGEASAKERELEGYIQALQAKKREMQEELRDYRATRPEAATGTAGGGASRGAGSAGIEAKVGRASSAFDRVLEKATGVPGHGNANAKTAAQLAELEDLARKNRVKERLEAIKAKVGGAQ